MAWRAELHSELDPWRGTAAKMAFSLQLAHCLTIIQAAIAVGSLRLVTDSDPKSAARCCAACATALAQTPSLATETGFACDLAVFCMLAASCALQ